MSQAVLDALAARFSDHIVETGSHVGDEFAVVKAESLYEIAEFLRDDPDMAFELPVDCTAIDYSTFGKPHSLRHPKGTPRASVTVRRPVGREPRFDVVYHLYSVSKKHRIRLTVRVDETQPECPSLTPLYPGLNWFERETYDMFGIRFTGHPDLRRILMYEEFEGYPLLKDYPHRKMQPRTPMRDLPDADIIDPALGPQTRPPGIAGDEVWRGQDSPAPTVRRTGIPGIPGPDGTIGGKA